MRLTLNDAHALAAILRASETGAHVSRQYRDGLVGGYVGRIVVSPQYPHEPGKGDDVRDCHIEIIAAGAVELWPVRDVMAGLRADLVTFEHRCAPLS